MVDIQRSVKFQLFFCQIVGGKMVHTELFQVKQIRRDVNFQFSLKKYDEFAAKFVDTWC